MCRLRMLCVCNEFFFCCCCLWRINARRHLHLLYSEKEKCIHLSTRIAHLHALWLSQTVSHPLLCVIHLNLCMSPSLSLELSLYILRLAEKFFHSISKSSKLIWFSILEKKKKWTVVVVKYVKLFECKHIFNENLFKLFH